MSENKDVFIYECVTTHKYYCVPERVSLQKCRFWDKRERGRERENAKKKEWTRRMNDGERIKREM